MSSSLHIFLRTGVTPREAAQRLAAALGAEPVERDGAAYVALRRDDAEIGGEVGRNVYGAPPDPEPDEISALDGYDIAWEIRRVPSDDDARRAAADHLLDETVDRLHWPALLVENLSALVAARHPGQDRVSFPAGTSPDLDDQDVWRPYA